MKRSCLNAPSPGAWRIDQGDSGGGPKPATLIRISSRERRLPRCAAMRWLHDDFARVFLDRTLQVFDRQGHLVRTEICVPVDLLGAARDGSFLAVAEVPGPLHDRARRIDRRGERVE